MSAWLCTDKHIRFVAKAAVAHGLVDDPDAFAQELKAENAASLRYRYEDRAEEHWPDLDDPVGDVPLDDVLGRIEDPAFVALQAACYNYQACEHPEYEASHVKGVVDALVAACGGHDVYQSDERRGSDALPWGI